MGRGNALLAISDNLARLVGSPLGGLAFALSGLPGVVIVDAVSFALTALLVAFTRPLAPRVREPGEESAPAVERRLLREWAEGIATILRNRDLLTITIIAVIGSVAQGVFLVLFIVYVTENLHAGDTEVGVLRGVQAIGGVLGGLLTGVLVRRIAPRPLIGVGYLVFGALSLLTWNLAPVTTAVWVYAGLFIAMGLPSVATETGEITLVQTITPRAALGRVFAAVRTLSGAAQGVGLLLAGLIASSAGTVHVLDAQASLYLLCGVLALVFLGGRARAGRDAVPEPAASGSTPS